MASTSHHCNLVQQHRRCPHVMRFVPMVFLVAGANDCFTAMATTLVCALTVWQRFAISWYGSLLAVLIGLCFGCATLVIWPIRSFHLSKPSS